MKKQGENPKKNFHQMLFPPSTISYPLSQLPEFFPFHCHYPVVLSPFFDPPIIHLSYSLTSYPSFS